MTTPVLLDQGHPLPSLKLSPLLEDPVSKLSCLLGRWGSGLRTSTDVRETHFGPEQKGTQKFSVLFLQFLVSLQ